MTRRIRLADVMLADLVDAERIVARDRRAPRYYKQMWTLTHGSTAFANGVATESGLLEVELNSTRPEQYQQLRELVTAAKEPYLRQMWDFNG